MRNIETGLYVLMLHVLFRKLQLGLLQLCRRTIMSQQEASALSSHRSDLDISQQPGSYAYLCLFGMSPLGLHRYPLYQARIRFSIPLLAQVASRKK